MTNPALGLLIPADPASRFVAICFAIGKCSVAFYRRPKYPFAPHQKW